MKSYLTRISASFSKKFYVLLSSWARGGGSQTGFFHVWWQSFNFISKRSFKMMIDFKDAVNLATNKDLWRNFSGSISIRSPLGLSVTICSSLTSCGFEFRRRLRDKEANFRAIFRAALFLSSRWHSRWIPQATKFLGGLLTAACSLKWGAKWT